MACNIKFKDSTSPFCFMRDGKLVNGTYVIDASDDGKELISEKWLDDEGNEVNPAEVEIADCPDCSKSSPVSICNIDALAEAIASYTPQRINLGTTCASIRGGSPVYVEVVGVFSKDDTVVVYAAKEDGRIVFYGEADVEVMLDCKCCCEGCDPCDLNPPDINYTNVDTGKIYKVWSKEVVGLTDVHITDISGNIDFWAMSTPECSCTTELTGIAGSSSFYAVPI